MSHPEPGPSSKGQRYYLYDNELSRPRPQFQPRPSGRFQRPPFHSHEYHGIYPTKRCVEDNNNKFYIPQPPAPKVPRDSRYYSRPPDEYHRPREEDYRDSGDRNTYSDHYDHHHRDGRRHSSERRSSHEFRDDRVRRVSDHARYQEGESRRASPERRRSRSPHPHSSSSRQPEASGSGRRTPESWEPPTDEFDLKIELHPLMHYVEDKPRLLKEAMSILGGKRLDALIPPALKHISHSRLEEMCLKELESVSLATIANVIDGKLISVDSTLTQKCKPKDESKSSPSKKVKVKSKKKKKNEVSIPVKRIKKKLKKAIADADDIPPSPKKKKRRKVEKDEADLPSHSKKKKLKKVKAKSKDKDKKKKKKKLALHSAESSSAIPGLPPQKTLMELLELEYRAKAIKALLKTQGLDMNRIDDALALNSSPSATATDSSSVVPQVQIPVEVKAPLAVAKTPPKASTSSVDIDIDKPSSSSTHPQQVITISAAVSPDSTVVTASDLTPVAKSQSPTHVSSSVTKEEDIVTVTVSSSSEDEEEIVEVTSDRKTVAVEEEELDYELDVICEEPPEPIEMEEGEIASGEESGSDAEESRDEAPVQQSRFGSFGKDNESIQSGFGSFSKDKEPIQSRFGTFGNNTGKEPVHSGFGTFGKEQERGKYVYSSESEDEGGWRQPDAVTEKRRKWVRAVTPEPAQVLSDISNQDFEEPIESKKGQAQDSDSDGGSLYQPRSPTPTDADGNKILEDSDSSDEDGPVVPDPAILIGPQLVHSCAEKPEDHEEEADAAGAGGSSYEESDEDTPRTWFNRWYNSKKVQRNVKSNKMLGRLRSKLRREKMIPDLPPPADPSAPDPDDADSIPVIGSIQEYERLFCTNKYKPLPKEPSPSPAEEPPEEEEEDNPEDEALWGDIMGTSSK